ncbi:ABC transporter ATP-binding protein [Streptacidiphilus jiangxiensis]|uniref:Spermidine/putrescine import ATP-binding protein PotA n=1 Tax=Streptacidiphilus jiangxiensis TaxID=235985 RepID=A0A1H7JGE2_STRJI|nr:ABC transporter ATP-binding protein [Streptacidiphilus jiangxiensis]SEK73679.1 spermidine/putrescine transport system ATP-binding protein [Streptacidiphilus jiangxiensis]
MSSHDVLGRTEGGDLRLVGLTKRYGSFTAVDDLSLTIPQGSFFALLGASGCGKTTTLRMISGLEDPTIGQIHLGDQEVTDLKPYRRPVNTVFQNYALFPHLDIYENVAFGLRRRGVKDVKTAVVDMLNLVELGHLAKRKPTQLSGGQQQRIALARALINQPQVLLLDEPLGALDLKLRRQMQIELKRIQTEVGLTFVHVTHDQEEAMTMADTIAVMNHGRIEQLGSPAELYENPATTFVANFLGQSNLIQAAVEGETDGVVTVSAHGQQLKLDAKRCRSTSGKIILGVRPEKVQIATDRADVPAGFNALTGGKVVDTSFIGVSTQYLVQMPSGEELSVFEQNTGRTIQRPGTEVVVYWDPSQGFGLEGTQDIEAGADADEEAAA